MSTIRKVTIRLGRFAVFVDGKLVNGTWDKKDFFGQDELTIEVGVSDETESALDIMLPGRETPVRIEKEGSPAYEELPKRLHGGVQRELVRGPVDEFGIPVNVNVSRKEINATFTDLKPGDYAKITCDCMSDFETHRGKVCLVKSVDLAAKTVILHVPGPGSLVYKFQCVEKAQPPKTLRSSIMKGDIHDPLPPNEEKWLWGGMQNVNLEACDYVKIIEEESHCRNHVGKICFVRSVRPKTRKLLLSVPGFGDQIYNFEHVAKRVSPESAVPAAHNPLPPNPDNFYRDPLGAEYCPGPDMSGKKPMKIIK